LQDGNKYCVVKVPPHQTRRLRVSRKPNENLESDGTPRRARHVCGGGGDSEADGSPDHL